MSRIRRTETESIEARDRRILDFPGEWPEGGCESAEGGGALQPKDGVACSAYSTHMVCSSRPR